MAHVSAPFTSFSMASEDPSGDGLTPSESMLAIHESLQLVYRLVLNDQLPHFQASQEVKALLGTASTTERVDGGAAALPILQSVQALLHASNAQSIPLPTSESQATDPSRPSSLLRHNRFEARVKDNSEDIFTKEQLMALFGQLRTFSPHRADAEWDGFVFDRRNAPADDMDSFADTYSSSGTISLASEPAFEFNGAASSKKLYDADVYQNVQHHADSEDEYVPLGEAHELSDAESEYDPARITRLTHHPEYDPRQPTRHHDEYDPTQPDRGLYNAEYDPTSPVQDSDYDPKEHHRSLSLNTPVVMSHVADIAAPQPSRLSSHFVSKMASAANSSYNNDAQSDAHVPEQHALANTTARRQTSPVHDSRQDRKQAKLLRREKARQEREARRARKRMARDAQNLAYQTEQQLSTALSPSSSRKESQSQLHTSAYVPSAAAPQPSPIQFAFPPSATPTAFPILPYGPNSSMFSGVAAPTAAATPAQPLGLGAAGALQTGQTLLLRDQLGNYYTAQYRGAQAPASLPTIPAAPTMPFTQQNPYGLPLGAPSQHLLHQQALDHHAMLQQAVQQQVIQQHAVLQQGVPQPIPQAAYAPPVAYNPHFMPISSTPLPSTQFPRPPY